MGKGTGNPSGARGGAVAPGRGGRDGAVVVVGNVIVVVGVVGVVVLVVVVVVMGRTVEDETGGITVEGADDDMGTERTAEGLGRVTKGRAPPGRPKATGR